MLDWQRQRNYHGVYMGTSIANFMNGDVSVRHRRGAGHMERGICRCRVIQTNVKFCVIGCHTLARYNPGKTRELNGPAVSASINFLVSDNEIKMVGSVMGTVVGGSTTGTSVVSVLLGRGRGL